MMLRLLSHRGFSIIAAVVACAMMGVSLLAFLKFMNTASRGQKFSELKGELTEVRMRIRNEMDCQKTLTSVCPNAAGAFPLRERNGNILVDASATSPAWPDGKSVGSWSLRWQCTGSALTLEIGKPKGNDGGLTRAITMKESDWVPAYTNGAACSGFFNGSYSGLSLKNLTEFTGHAVTSISGNRATDTTVCNSAASTIYRPQGNKLHVGMRASLGARGTGQVARVFLRVRKVSTGVDVVPNYPAFSLGSPDNNHGLTVPAYADLVVNVDQGADYEFSFSFCSYDSGSSSASAVSEMGQPLKVVVSDYATN